MVRLPYCPACGGRTGAETRAEPSGRSCWRAGPRRSAETTGIAWSCPRSRSSGMVITSARSPAPCRCSSGSGRPRTDRARPTMGRCRCTSTSPDITSPGDIAASPTSAATCGTSSSGKGATDAQARASGLCEGLERYSGVFRGDEPRRRAAPADSATPPSRSTIACTSATGSIASATSGMPRKSHYNFVPVPLDPDAEVDWTPVWSLTRQEPRYLPTAFCYFNAPQPDGEPFCIGDSNGNAAGNTLEEAILQGFLELVERDAVALWWYNRVKRPEVDLDSFADPYLDRVRVYLRERGRELWVIDLTSDLNIPVFAGHVARNRWPGGADHAGLRRPPRSPRRAAAGRHRDEPDAVEPARTNGRPPGPGTSPSTTQETLEWLRSATVANQPYLLPDAAAEPPKCHVVSAVVVRRRRRGRAVVPGVGRGAWDGDDGPGPDASEIGLPVVKVIVPGLRHFWARYAPGRLYDVPVRLGWLSAPTPEEELNPIPMFL